VMSRWAAAAQRAYAARPPRPPKAARESVTDDAVRETVREAARQAAATRDDVRRAAAPTVDIPETPFRHYQPHPRPVPTPRAVYPTMPHYERPEYRRPVYRPAPSPSTNRNGGAD
jgi:hypothetical protein